MAAYCTADAVSACLRAADDPSSHAPEPDHVRGAHREHGRERAARRPAHRVLPRTGARWGRDDRGGATPGAPDRGADAWQLPERRRHRPASPSTDRGLSRRERRCRDDPAAVSRRSARRRRQLVRAELVAVRPPLLSRRRRQPRDERGGHRRRHRRLRRLSEACPRRGLRWRRAVRGVPRAHRAVLDAMVEPAHGRVGRLVRGPDALLVHAAGADPRDLRRRLHRRPGGQHRRAFRADAVDRRACARWSRGTTSGA